ncbi:hypothetical protein KIM372_08270 [Bombiscardovia nodaiensis]|uniref:Uncharacterized protein n=1 Tax=Bombiscardovia nodaiensis TaxID=2932181 RepID=A0ABM8B847_9BIFI|nr:hypothetical protein KIM372_08270 [Bombiscardovia nodaiensis]
MSEQEKFGDTDQEQQAQPQETQPIASEQENTEQVNPEQTSAPTAGTGEQETLPAGQPQAGQAQGNEQPQPPVNATPGVPQGVAGAMPPAAFGQSDGMGQPVDAVQAVERATKKRSAIVAIVVVIVAVIVATLLVLKPWGIKPADYKDAAQAVSQLQEQKTLVSDQLTKVYRKASTSDKAMNSQDTAGLKSAIEKFDKESAGLANLKALKDKDVNNQYQAYLQKSKAYSKYVEGLVESAPAFSKAASKCGNTPKYSSSAETDKYLKSVESFVDGCKTGLQESAKAPNKSIADYTSKAADTMSKLQDVLKQMTDMLGSINESNLDASISKMSDLQDQAQELEEDAPDFSEFTSKLKDEDDKASPDQALKDLRRVLNDKAK